MAVYNIIIMQFKHIESSADLNDTKNSPKGVRIADSINRHNMIVSEFSYKGYACAIKRNPILEYLMGYIILPKGHKRNIGGGSVSGRGIGGDF